MIKYIFCVDKFHLNGNKECLTICPIMTYHFSVEEKEKELHGGESIL